MSPVWTFDAPTFRPPHHFASLPERIQAADRKDFYHQAKVSRARAFTNVLPFEYEPELVRDLKAWDVFEEVGKPVKRETHGDRLGQTAIKPLREKDVAKVTLGFKSLFQGDHLGVEFALESHTVLLQSGGLLHGDETYLEGARD